jgi:hypothetical protein
MRWLKPNLRSSIWALFGGPPEPPSTVIQQVSVDDIRGRMHALAESVGGERSQQVVRRIRYASDVEALWFIRSELMALLAGDAGGGGGPGGGRCHQRHVRGLAARRPALASQPAEPVAARRPLT